VNFLIVLECCAYSYKSLERGQTKVRYGSLSEAIWSSKGNHFWPRNDINDIAVLQCVLLASPTPLLVPGAVQQVYLLGLLKPNSQFLFMYGDIAEVKVCSSLNNNKHSISGTLQRLRGSHAHSTPGISLVRGFHGEGHHPQKTAAPGKPGAALHFLTN
jgi:hypothetical protein